MQTLSPPLQPQSTLFVSKHLIPAFTALFLFLLHLLLNLQDSYGIFRDEFYYLACAKRLAWGYVDQPPLSIFLLSWQSFNLGDSLPALRVLPALALSGSVYLSGLMVVKMKGGSVAQLLCCIAVALAPIYLAMGSYYSMNSLDIFFWTATFFIMLKLIASPRPEHWLIIGIILGLGLLNKIGVLWLGAGLFVGMLLSPLRKEFKTPWPYAAALIALLMFMPFVLWNLKHDLAHLEFMQKAIADKYSGINRLDFISGVLLQMNPLALTLWLPGLYFLLFHADGKKYRLLGIIFLCVFSVLLLMGHSKSEYLAPAFPVLFAGGAVIWERVCMRIGRLWFSYLLATILLISGLMLAPLARPILPVEDFIAYSRWLGITPENSEGKETKELHQFYADRFGWPELAATVSAVYTSLPFEEQKSCKVYTQNYGEAGALEYYQQSFPLPPVISGHNAYWSWGPGLKELETLIIVGGEKSSHLRAFEEVTEAARHQSRHAMPYEADLPIWVCRYPRVDLYDIWPELKNFN